MIEQYHNLIDGKPSGGTTFGPGFAIGWQNGPLGREPNKLPQNGAFVSDIIEAAKGRLEHFQTTQFANEANKLAISHLNLALMALAQRANERDSRGVLGTHTV